MARSVLLFLQLCVTAAFLRRTEPSDVVSATVLRGSQAADVPVPPKVELEAGTQQGNAAKTAECAACSHKAQCGCEPAMDYLACITKNCYSSGQAQFMTLCSTLQGICSTELDIDCQGADTVCQSKFNQLPSGGLGLSWDTTAAFDDAYCGPTGNCVGSMRMHVNIHNLLTKTETSMPGKTANDTSTLMLECGLPIAAKAEFGRKEDWLTCTSDVRGDKANCDIRMLRKLPAQQLVGSYCVIIDRQKGTKLTQPVWRNVKNSLKKEEALDGNDEATAAEATAEEAMNEALEAKPPYMKDSDAEMKTPPRDSIVRIGSEVKDLDRLGKTRAAEAVHDQNQKVRGGAARFEKEAAEARGPIVKEVEIFKMSSEDSGADAAEQLSQASDAADSEAKHLHDARRKATRRLRQVDVTAKPPYMEGSDSEEKTPLPDLTGESQPPDMDGSDTEEKTPVPGIADLRSPTIADLRSPK